MAPIVVAAIVVLLFGCSSSPEEAGPSQCVPKPDAACVKESDKELCFDGVDNNCDGCVDEGCPVRDAP